jgi:hypothetical protein
MFVVRDCVTSDLEVMNVCCQRLCDIGFGGNEWLLPETYLRVGGDEWLLSETESWRG